MSRGLPEELLCTVMGRIDRGDFAARNALLTRLIKGLRGLDGINLSPTERGMVADVLEAIRDGGKDLGPLAYRGAGNPKWTGLSRNQKILGNMRGLINQGMTKSAAARETVKTFGLEIQPKTVLNIWNQYKDDPDFLLVIR